MDQKTLDQVKNPDSRYDVQELEDRINKFKNFQITEEKFRAYRLARGVYGQRQNGVQMIRIKLPYGRLTPVQMKKIADVCQTYANDNLHVTTRQDIQTHFAKLEDSPKIWAELEKEGVTMREACGNTVRNVTGSSKAGVDPNEPFDVTPYADACVRYFLRNPICQEMGRKFKISWSSSEEDSAFSFMHDLGFVPKVKEENGQERRGFKVLVGGGLGAQAIHAHQAYEFLPEEEVIPFAEAVLRTFDRYGERNKRNKARIKFLVKSLGFEKFMELVEEQKTALKNKEYWVDRNRVPELGPKDVEVTQTEPVDADKYQAFLDTNVFEQKQKGYYAVDVRVTRGDLSSDEARAFADVVSKYASDDIRTTVHQGYLLRHVPEKALPELFNELDKLGLAEPGSGSTADITACPGTDTCNLGITSSTGAADALEKVIKDEYPDLVYNNDIKIKISGCFNACGQHNIANIGFHGMSMKKDGQVLPALQLLLGGGVNGDGNGVMADKILKIPSKRVPEALRTILDDYNDHSYDGEYFNDYYRRKNEEQERYFFSLLKPLADTEKITDDDFIDWGTDQQYEKHIGVGECAGVITDLVGTLLGESEEKLAWGFDAYKKEAYADSIYHAYNTFITTAKAALTAEDVNCNTHIDILDKFDQHLVETGEFSFDGSTFKDRVLEMNNHEPSQEFAGSYLEQARNFYEAVLARKEDQKDKEKVQK